MRKFTTVNRNGQFDREDSGQFAITTAARKNELQAKRERRAEELKSELGGWAASVGISEDELCGLFA